ncbi:MAG: hypothetical protein VB095_06925 [Anaerovorax sp.]|nr:hypothetical protein [Anaerovorax sp.]
MWIGIILIVSSICGLFFWEAKGREFFLMDQVFVAAERIPMGTEVNSDQFKLVYVLRENKVPKAFSKEDRGRLQGKVTAQIIEKNQQITMGTFCKERTPIEEGKSVFLIKPEWIDSRSSSLRRGDWVDFYLAESGTFIGCYPIAFVKDEKEKEVKNDETITQDYILERTDANAQISHIEIIAALSDYEGIRHMAEESSEKFLLVQTIGKEK